MRVETCNRCDTSSGFISDFHKHFGINRQEYIDTRTKLDESHVIFDSALLTRLGICDYAASHGAGHLIYYNILTRRGAYQHRAVLILHT